MQVVTAGRQDVPMRLKGPAIACSDCDVCQASVPKVLDHARRLRMPAAQGEDLCRPRPLRVKVATAAPTQSQGCHETAVRLLHYRDAPFCSRSVSFGRSRSERTFLSTLVIQLRLDLARLALRHCRNARLSRHVLEQSLAVLAPSPRGRRLDESLKRAPCRPRNHEEAQHVVSAAALPASNSVGLLLTASATVPPPPSLVPPRLLDCAF